MNATEKSPVKKGADTVHEMKAMPLWRHIFAYITLGLLCGKIRDASLIDHIHVIFLIINTSLHESLTDEELTESNVVLVGRMVLHLCGALPSAWVSHIPGSHCRDSCIDCSCYNVVCTTPRRSLARVYVFICL